MNITDDQITKMHELMKDEARKLGLPKFFKNDLEVHDLTALHHIADKGITIFWWRLRESGTQFSSHSELYMRLGFESEQENAFVGDLEKGTLTRLPPYTKKTHTSYVQNLYP